MSKTPNRSVTVTMRMTPETLEATEKVAALTCRTVSSLLEYALKLYIQKNYPQAFSPNARLMLRLDDAPAEVTP